MKIFAFLPMVVLVGSLVSGHAELIPRKPVGPPAPVVKAPPLTDEEMKKLQDQVAQLEKDLAKKRNGMHASQIATLKEAMSGNEKAYNFWLDCKKEQDFDMKGKTATEFSEWKRDELKKSGSNDAFAASLRLQIHFLMLAVLDSHVETPAQEAEVAAGATAYIESLVAFCEKEEDLAKSILGSIMDMSLDPEAAVTVGSLQESLKKAREASAALGGQVLDSIFAKHLKLDGSVDPRSDAVSNPGNIDEIYDRMIIKSILKKQDAAAISSVWTKRIEQTARVAKATKVKELVEMYETVKVPAMKFAMYSDQWKAGQQKQAAAQMMSLIAAHPTHKDSNRWLEQLKKLTSGEEATP
jgi:hypothetical protein